MDDPSPGYWLAAGRAAGCGGNVLETVPNTSPHHDDAIYHDNMFVGSTRKMNGWRHEDAKWSSKRDEMDINDQGPLRSVKDKRNWG